MHSINNSPLCSNIQWNRCNSSVTAVNLWPAQQNCKVNICIPLQYWLVTIYITVYQLSSHLASIIFMLCIYMCLLSRVK
jgi:hypothetical protein